MSRSLLAPTPVTAPSRDPATARPLVVRGLSKTFVSGLGLPWSRRTRRRVRAVQDVSFEVPRGSIYGLIGANGSGKSTLIRVLSTLVVADEGEVTIFGYDVERDSMQARQLINIDGT